MLEKFIKIERHNSHFISTVNILLSLFLGIACGLLLGDYAAKLQILGDIYIGLLQMTVVPYIMFALIANIGRLKLVEARFLTRQGVFVLLVLWSVGAVTVWAMSLALPKLNHGSYFSSLMVEQAAPFDFLKLFIPANPFLALSENAIPAIVLFSMMFGAACIGFKEHHSLLKNFEQAAKILLRVNSFVVMLTPIGVFGIAASAAGTLTLEQFGKVQAYVFMLVGAVLVVTLVILPLLIVSCTPFSYRQILRESRNALLTVFVVGSVFVVIPLLIKGVSRLYHEHVSAGSEHARIPDMVLPLAYPFPDMGKLLSLVFIVFAAWFYDRPLHFLDFPEMLVLGLFLSFGKLVAALPFLLDFYRIPDDVFNLFMTVGVFCGRVADVAGAMHLMTFTILTTALMTGQFKIKWKLLIRNLGISLLFLVVVVLSIRFVLEKQNGVDDDAPRILQMHLLNEDVPYTVSSLSMPNSVGLKQGEHLIDRIRRQGVIHVGVHEDSLPFSYYNSSRHLVGFDIDLVLVLAKDLGVEVEFVPYESEYLLQQLEEDHFDIAISGITPNLQLLASTRVLYSVSYLDTHLAFVVKDHLHKQFEDLSAVLNRQNSLKVVVRRDSIFASRIRELFPQVHIVELDSEADFFATDKLRDYVLLTTAEGGSAWTLIYPDYAVVTPFSDKQGAPVVIAVGGQDLMLEHFISTWIKLKQTDGTIDRLFRHWIRGEIL